MKSSAPLHGDHEEWTVIWFPPDGDKSKTFQNETAAKRFAKRDDHKVDVANWNPLLVHRVIKVTETMIPLEGP